MTNVEMDFIHIKHSLDRIKRKLDRGGLPTLLKTELAIWAGIYFLATLLVVGIIGGLVGI